MSTRSQSSFIKSPLAPYYFILFSLLSLCAFGLVMVLSASSVKSLQDYGSVYAIFLKQLLFLGIAVCVGWLTMRSKMKYFSLIGRFAIPVGALLLILPIFIGRSTNGNRNWIPVGPFTIQPSEFAKLLLVIWCAAQLKRFEQSNQAHETMQLLGRILPGAFIFLALIMAGNDLGTALTVMGIVAAMLYIGGLSMRSFAVISLGGVLATAGAVISKPNRLHRFAAVLDPFKPSVYKFAGWQPAHSIMGLASGGLFGVGLGASQQKWANLSEAHTDFIFTVIGEELGLLGTLFVLTLYVLLLYGIFRTAMQSKDLFFKYATAGVGAWILAQVVVNVGSDIGIFPVVGVTLPFISYGGSSLIANVAAIGLVLNGIRKSPDLAQALEERGLLKSRRAVKA